MNNIFKLNSVGTYDFYPCGDKHEMRINSGNGDANCHRNIPSYAVRLVKKDNTICNNCVYNKLK